MSIACVELVQLNVATEFISLNLLYTISRALDESEYRLKLLGNSLAFDTHF